jgi:hypothetical protein
MKQEDAVGWSQFADCYGRTAGRRRARVEAKAGASFLHACALADVPGGYPYLDHGETISRYYRNDTFGPRAEAQKLGPTSALETRK